MPSPRDTVRSNRSQTYREARDVGVNLDQERQRIGSNQRMLAFEAGKLINDPVPRVDRESQQSDDPPVGAFDGVNTIFLLTEPAVGFNIHVIWGDTANNRTILLNRTTQNPPPNEAFFYDINQPTVIVVGNPPLPGDRLIAIYRVKR